MASYDYKIESTTVGQSHDKVSDLVKPNLTPATVKETYNEWANNYEVDEAKVEYRNFRTLATYIQESELVKSDSKILDIGAGTGLHGIELKKYGYENIDAVEPSQEMIAKAEKQNVYRRTIVDFVGANRLDIDEGTYDVITGAGCFAPSHIDSSSFKELNRILKQGGYFFLACSQRYYEDEYEGYAAKIDSSVNEYIEKGVWTQIRKDTIPYLAHYYANVTVLQKK